MKLEFLEKTRVSITSVRMMAEVLEEDGQSVDQMLAQSDFTAAQLQDPNFTISGLKELSFQNRFVQLTGYRPDLWACLGRRYRWLHYGDGGLAAATAPNLHHFADSFSSWIHMTFSLGAPMPIWDSDADTITGLEFDLTEVPENLRAFTVFRDMGASATFMCDVLAIKDPILNFECAFPDPELDGLAGILNATGIRFEALRTGCFWGAEQSKSTLPNADPLLHQSYLERCRENEERVSVKGGFLQSIVTILQSSTVCPSMDDVAHELGVSKRTLQRRIQDHGMTFHDLRGTVLARQACEMLRNSNRSIAEIGWAIGYSEATGFTHAFRRWTGLSPSAYRAGQRAPSERRQIATSP